MSYFNGESSSVNVDMHSWPESDNIFSYDLAQSPFASVIETNYNPSREDIIHLEVHLAEPQLRLSQLESEIAQLNNLLETFSMKRDLVKRYIEAHRALMSPIRRLPVETLSEIFMHCLPEDRYGIRDLSEAPLLLTGVSHQWRQTAIDTPALWKSLHLHLPWGISTQSVEKRTIGCLLWLKRSGLLPLSISLSTETGPPQTRQQLSLVRRWRSTGITNAGPWMECLNIFMTETLLKYSNRIERLFFAGSSPFMNAQLDQLATHCFPTLKVFRVCNTGVSSGYRPTREPALPFASLVQQMPALNNLAVIGFSHSGRQYAQLELGWGNLTELVVTSPPLPMRQYSVAHFSSQEILAILGCACRLQSLTISVDLSTGWSNDTTILDLPSMRKMRLAIFDLGQIEQEPLQARTCLHNVYRSLLCPSLRTLHVSWHAMYLKEIPFCYASLVELETLSLDMPLTSSTLMESLALFPSLRFLEVMIKAIEVRDPSQDILSSLAWHSVDDTLLTSLVTSEGGHMLCPNLQHIRIIYKDNLPSGISNDALLTLLENRVETKMLQSCDIFFAQPRAESTEDESRRFRALVDLGLKLRIRYGQLPPSYPDYNDAPETGLLTFNPLDISDMEGPYGTGVIV